jgi:NAD(P)-dependent dehydrogenase (short-subunit alcohol dehydrogenase family)
MSRASFQGKICVVTGGASGIGRALCEALARAGAQVTLADLDEARAAEVAAAIGPACAAVRVDVTRAAEVRALLEGVAARHGRLDYVFNNAGISCIGEIRDTTLEDFDRVLDVNLRGVVHGSYAAYAIMLKQGHGHIVNTASGLGLAPSAGLAGYVASKFAVVGFSETLRLEAAALGVKVSVVCPGFIDTPMVTGARPARGDAEATLKAIPVKLADPADLARCVLDGVAEGEGIISYPRYVAAAVAVYRLLPGVAFWFGQKTLAKLRRLRARAQEKV